MLRSRIVKTCDLIIQGGALAIVFFTPLIFDVSLSCYNFFDLYKAVFFRTVLTFMLLSYAAKIFIQGKIYCRGGKKIFLPVFFLLASFFLSSLLSVHPGQSFWGGFLRQQGFYNFFHYLLFFVLLVLNLKDFKQVKRLVLAAVGSACLSSVYGLAQYFALDPIPWDKSILASGRIFSTLGQPNFFGHFLILTLPLSLYGLFFLAKNFWARCFFGLAVVLEAAGLVLTYSRAAWLGFFGAMTFLLFFWLWFKGWKKTAAGFAGLVLIGALAVVGLNLGERTGQNGHYILNPLNRLKSIVDFRSGSNQMRLYYLQAGLAEIRRESVLKLLFGHGPETLDEVFIKYYQPDWGVYEAINSLPDRAHNWLFDQILALGFFGLAVTVWFYSYFVYQAFKFLKARPAPGSDGWLVIFFLAALTAYFINNLFSFSLFTNLVYLYLLLALVWFLINSREEVRETNVRLAVFSRLIIWLALLAAGVIFLYTNNFSQVRAELFYVKALKAMRTYDCAAVMDNLEKTLNLSPNSSYYQENYLFLTANCFLKITNRAARESWRQLIVERTGLIKDKNFYGILVNLARIYGLFGFYLDPAYYAEADKVFDRLTADYPNMIYPFEDWGKQKMMQGDFPAALKFFERSFGMLPPLDHPALNSEHRGQIENAAVRLYEDIGQAQLKIGDYDQAAENYKKGLSFDPYRATLRKKLADIYYLQGDLNRAIDLNRRGLTLNPTDYHWPLSLSLLYREQGDLVKAREYLGQALKLEPENEELKKYEKEINK